jgi:multidrug efflux pump subunit AcrA (membrane-fusion protein)
MKREPLPAPPRVMILVCLCSVLSSLGMTNWLDSRSLKVWRGQLETVSDIVVAPLDTRIVSLELSPGDDVKSGDVLVRMDASALDEQIATQMELIEQLKLELQQLEAKADVELSWRIKAIDDDIHANQLKSADLLKEKYLAEFGDVAWSNFLTEDTKIHIVSAQGVKPLIHSLPIPDEARIRAMLQQEAAHNASEVYAAQVEMVEARLNELKTLKAGLPDQIRDKHGIPLVKHKLELAKQKLEQLEERKAQSEIISPAFGTVGLFQKRVGDLVGEGEPLVEILDRAQEFVAVSIPSSDLHLFEVGQEVVVEFPGFDARLGQISVIPPQSSASNERGESCFEVKIAPTDKSWPEVPFGSNVNVAIQQ